MLLNSKLTKLQPFKFRKITFGKFGFIITIHQNNSKNSANYKIVCQLQSFKTLKNYILDHFIFELT